MVLRFTGYAGHRHQLLRPAGAPGRHICNRAHHPDFRCPLCGTAGVVSGRVCSALCRRGKFLDVIGIRAGFAISMAWWSLACALHGIAPRPGDIVAQERLRSSGFANTDLVCCSRSMAIHELISCQTHRTYLRGGNYSLRRRARSHLIQPLNPGPGIGTWGTRPPPANFQAAFF
jgi:hypothetical protein